MDDLEKIRRKRAIKVIITDIIMALSVITIAFVLIMIVIGWRINSDFTVEQNGLVSVRTKPTNVSVIIDDSPNHQTSNMSKMLPGGEHKVVLQKEGYDSWEKTITITPGRLTRLEYPRLFKQSREIQTIKSFDSLKFFYVSPDRTTAILSEGDTTEWFIVTDFNSSKPKFKSIDIKGIFKGTDDGSFNYNIDSLEWSKNNERILIHVSDANEWGIINLKSVKDSVNLSSDYPRYEANSNEIHAISKKTNKKELSSVKFENEVGDKVIAMIENNLVRLDTASKVISADLVDKVEDFALYDSKVIYKTVFEEGKSYIKFLRLGEENPTIVAVVSEEDIKTTFALTFFNSTNYLLYTIGNHLYVYSGRDFPTSNDNKFMMKEVINEELKITPTEAKKSRNNEFIVFREGSNIAVFDTELESYKEYDYGNEKIKYLDDFIFYRADESTGKFLAWDFDGTNVRALLQGRGTNDYDALISEDDKYFYYIAKDRDEENNKNYYSLIQEKNI